MARHFIVSGASGGIGAAIAAGLAAGGAEVTLVARGGDRLTEVAARLGPRATALGCDLASQADIRRAAAVLGRRPIDGLVLDAAIVPGERRLTVDGLEEALAVNHVAPYLLTRLLTPALPSGSRVVVLGADPAPMARAPVDLDDLQLQKGFTPVAAYMRSKNMNAMFAYALARRLADRGILVNAAHPGIIRTSLARNATGLLRLAVRLAQPFLPDPRTGAGTPFWLATDPGITSTGGFCKKRRQVLTAEHTRDRARQDALWNLSAELVGLAP